MSEIDKDINVPNKNDLISRREALEALGEEPPVWTDSEGEIAERSQWRRDVAAVKAVQTAQPEITHCADCLHWKYSAVRNSYCEVFDWMSKAEDFCSFAEKRTDG